MSSHTLSESAQRALAGARDAARRLGHDSVGVEHVMLGLLEVEPATAPTLRSLGLDATELRPRLEAAGRRARGRGPAPIEGELPFTSHAKRLIEVATRAARERGGPLSSEHLLFAALAEPRGIVARLLGDAGIAPAAARAVADRVVGGDTAPSVTRRRERGPARTTPAPPPPRAAVEPPAPVVAEMGWGAWLRYGLLLAVPVSIVLAYIHASPVAVFAAACLGVLPLAGLMGEATEHLSYRTGPTVGGLLNATFGNAAELIIAIVALRAGLVDLVKASITGSILGNLLLILGLALVAGGATRSELKFNRTGAGMSAGMLALAVAGLIFPALFHSIHPEAAARASELHMSEGVAIVLLVTYGCSLLFSLRTHRRLFAAEPHPMDGPIWSVGRAVLVLAAATVGVAVESEILVHATEAVTADLGLSPVFLGLIVIPIIGNAAEHAAAVMVARKGQIDLALHIALGSSTQVALLVAPLLVFTGLILGHRMDLVFRPFEVMALGMATAIAAIITLDGESHWFEGVQLLAVYGMVAIAAFFI